jgi:predicted nucleic acid-binding protein
VIYWDTSALVKQFITEVGTSEVLTFRRTQNDHATSMIAYPEVISALHRRNREQNLSDNQYRTARNLFFQDWPSYIRIPIGQSLLERVVSVIDVIRSEPLTRFILQACSNSKPNLKNPVT